MRSRDLVEYSWDPKTEVATLHYETQYGAGVRMVHSPLPALTLEQAREGYYSALKFWLRTQVG